MYTVKVKPRYKYRYRCSGCGSEDVVVRAEVYWDYDRQEWRFSEFLGDDDWCNNCQCECCIEDVREEIKDEWPPSS